MKILVIGRALPDRNKGSFGLFEFQQTVALGKYVDVSYLFVENTPILSKYKKINKVVNGIPTIGRHVPLKGFFGLFNLFRSKMFISIYDEYMKLYGKPDIVHVHFPTIVLNDKIIDFFEKNRIKLVVTEHWSKVQNKELSKRKIKLLKRISAFSEFVVCVSDQLKKSIDELTENKTNTIVIPNMISDIFFKQKTNRSSIDNKFVFTYIGSFVRTKRIELLVSAFENEFLMEDNIKLNIVGGGGKINSLKRMIKDKTLEKINFTGAVSNKEVVNYLSYTSAYVSASKLETFGVPFVEALAMGIPIIAADNLPIAKYINHENGLLFKVDNQKDLQTQMRKIYVNKENYDSKMIAKNIYDIFSSDIIVKQLLELYNEINNKKGKPI